MGRRIPECAADGYKPLPGAVRARSKVRGAVLRGHLPEVRDLACEDCGAPAIAYDHRDYNRPLDVAPVCRSCNWIRGAGIPLGCNYESKQARGVVVGTGFARPVTFDAWDFGIYEEAAQSSVVGADPSGFDSLDSHGLKHGCASPATPLN